MAMTKINMQPYLCCHANEDVL